MYDIIIKSNESNNPQQLNNNRPRSKGQARKYCVRMNPISTQNDPSNIEPRLNSRPRQTRYDNKYGSR